MILQNMSILARDHCEMREKGITHGAFFGICEESLLNTDVFIGGLDGGSFTPLNNSGWEIY